MRYKKGMFIGRFQPMHRGHLKVVEKMSEECEEIIIGVGSAQISREEKNPLNYEERKEIISNVLENQGIRASIINVDDVPADEDWIEMVLSYNFDAIYSSNKWVLRIAETAKREKNLSFNIIDVKPEVDSETTRYISATLVREMIKNDDSRWKALVPEPAPVMIEERCIQWIKR